MHFIADAFVILELFYTQIPKDIDPQIHKSDLTVIHGIVTHYTQATRAKECAEDYKATFSFRKAA
jgi:hypothetical protein